MGKIGSYEAKTNLAKLLREVESGKHFTITRHGTPVAELVPADNCPDQPPAETISKLKEFRKTHRLGSNTSIQELKAKGRR